jgi:hypothetical protein
MLTEERERAGTGRPKVLNWATDLKLRRGRRNKKKQKSENRNGNQVKNTAQD